MTIRGVECVGMYLNPVTNDPVLKMQCDCGTLTNLEARSLVMTGGTGETFEFAYTCDGCVSSHWMTITRLRSLPGDF